MPLSSEQVYDELTGAEVKQILIQRFKDLLDTVPDFQPHLTLPRVRMSLKIHLDIYGRRNSAIDLVNDFLLRDKDHADDQVEVQQELEAEDFVNADTGAPVAGTAFDGTGDPPDQVRVEHDLPVHEPVRDRVTRSHAQRPTVVVMPAQPEPAAYTPPVAPHRPPGGRRYAAFHYIEREGPALQGFSNYLPGAEPFTRDHHSSDKQAGKVEERTAGVQQDFRETRLGADREKE